VQQDSELLRMPLEEVCLQAKALGVAGRSPSADQTGELLRFLSKAMDAPHPLAISNAVEALKHIGCLTELEQITPMGVMLSKFTMHPRLGWMVLLGVLCGCPTAAVTAACAVAGRDPFVVPMDPVQKRQAMAAKVALSRGYRSDQFALVTALSAFNMYRQRVSFYELVRFCDEQFLSMSSLTMYADTVQQTVREVKDLRIHAAQQTKNENDHSLLVALIGVGLYPNHAVRSRNQTHWFTPTEQRARIHNGSVNNIAAAKLRAKCQETIQIVAFQNLVENKTGMRFASANLMMMNTTPLHVLLLLLIADEIHEVSCAAIHTANN
jgi:ATP-dependent RNA helicase DHX36